METSPSRVESEDQRLEDQRLFEPVPAASPARRLSKAESLAYVRSIRAQLHRVAAGTDRDHRTEHRRVA